MKKLFLILFLLPATTHAIGIPDMFAQLNKGAAEINIYGYEYVTISDDKGNKNPKIGDIGTQKIPDTEIEYLSKDQILIRSFPDANLTIEAEPFKTDAAITFLIFNTEHTAEKGCVYKPHAGAKWQLKTSNSNAVFSVDKNNNGKFEDSEIIQAKICKGSNPTYFDNWAFVKSPGENKVIEEWPQ